MDEKNYKLDYDSLGVGNVVYLKEDSETQGIKRGIYEIVAMGEFKGEDTKITIKKYDNYDEEEPQEKLDERKSEVTLKEINDEIYLIEQHCPSCRYKSYLFVAEEDYIRRQEGRATAQECYPYLTIPQCELAISGTCYSCQHILFAKNYDKKGRHIGEKLRREELRRGEHPKPSRRSRKL